jgi:hypothetical protein
MLEENTPGSQLALRLGYNSNVLYAGRTLGINQFGLSPGITFYHTSGFYADVSSYWSNDFEPKYYLTTLSAGYTHFFSPVFSMAANYDRYFYNLPDDYSAFNNGLSSSAIADVKFLSFQCYYTYYFGDFSAHRVMPSFGLNLNKKGLFGIERINFSPTAYFLFGNQTYSEVEIIFPETPLEWLKYMNQYGTPYKLVITEKNVFGIMNYAFTLPLIVSHKDWSFSLSYTYNIPKELPGETLQLSESGFLAASVSYYINLKRKSSLW